MPIGDSSQPWVAAVAPSASGAAESSPAAAARPRPWPMAMTVFHDRRMIITGRRRYGAGTTTRIASGR